MNWRGFEIPEDHEKIMMQMPCVKKFSSQNDFIIAAFRAGLPHSGQKSAKCMYRIMCEKAGISPVVP